VEVLEEEVIQMEIDPATADKEVEKIPGATDQFSQSAGQNPPTSVSPVKRKDLLCPFKDKDVVKAAGAHWDAAKKTWFALYKDDDELDNFKQWLPENRSAY